MSTNEVENNYLRGTEFEAALYEFQHGAICFAEAFYRYMAGQLLLITGDSSLSGQDCVILQTIRASGRAKSIPEIYHFTNRTDVTNVQYSIKKLIKAGLVAKADRGRGRGVSYTLTSKGIQATDEYDRARKEFIKKLPMGQAELIGQLSESSTLLRLLTGLYDDVSRSLTVA